MGEAIKIPLGDGKFYSGYESPCPGWLKKKYREGANFICKDCKKHEKKVGTLEPHRLKRGCEGGLYTVLPLNHVHSNVKMCCHKCHSKYDYSRKTGY